MAFRSKTYVTYNNDYTQEPKSDDIQCVRQLMDWKVRDEAHISFINAMEKAAATADESQQLKLVHAIKSRLANSTNFLLIMSSTIKEETPWVRFEIEWAVDQCKIPIIAAYKGYESILSAEQLEHHWPPAFDMRIRNGTMQAIHIPFKAEPLQRAIGQFDKDNQPKGGLSAYTKGAYDRWGLG
jgi:hypothetical protein